VLNISEKIKKINKTQQIATKENGGSANKKEHSRPQQLSKKFSLKETNKKKSVNIFVCLKLIWFLCFTRAS